MMDEFIFDRLVHLRVAGRTRFTIPAARDREEAFLRRIWVAGARDIKVVHVNFVVPKCTLWKVRFRKRKPGKKFRLSTICEMYFICGQAYEFVNSQWVFRKHAGIITPYHVDSNGPDEIPF